MLICAQIMYMLWMWVKQVFKMSKSVTKWAVRRIYQKDSLQFAHYAKIESYLFHEKDDVTIKLEQEMAAPVTLT